ncbi:MAG: hypothetical protein ACLUL3_07545 [Romboutsia timonensis]|jgi:hypothetical protein|uniref:hypothetical protein n=1 Tax=Romboutsia timonensis TaxID=1776391 RepID=UPI0020640BDB|nr:hypothetical protein [uncultured Romboutsia sp.]DAM61453.1 MAG TPA: zipper dimerization domain transcription factor-like protein [Caudoviricetes sp.]
MRFYFTTEEEKNHIVNNNSDKEIIALHYDINFGYIDFSSETEMQVLQNKISILEAKNKRLEEGLQAVLSGDMQSLAYILYPEDFADINNTTLEL